MNLLSSYPLQRASHLMTHDYKVEDTQTNGTTVFISYTEIPDVTRIGLCSKRMLNYIMMSQCTNTEMQQRWM